MSIDNAVVAENRREGAPGWISESLAAYRTLADTGTFIEPHARSARDSGSAPDITAVGTTVPPIGGGVTPSRIAGYADKQSVNVGEPIGLHVSSQAGNFNVEIYRIGWYSGAGAALVRSYSNVTGVARATPAPDSLGTVACGWPTSVTVDTTAFVSGYFVAAFIPLSEPQNVSYTPFVVRDDGRASDVLVQAAFATYQAYNPFGGKSVYDYNSGGYANGVNTSGTPARKVSFDRPYQYFAGTGQLFYGDYQLIRWLEREGYDVTYAASWDTHQRPGLMNNKRMFMSAFHDEYWTGTARMNLEGWLASGRSAMFLGANSIYWVIRWESNDRTLVCYKDSSDPVPNPAKTMMFADPAVGNPEELLFGGAYDWFNPYGVKTPWVVSNAVHWIYNGTGLSNGSQIPDLVGFEWDRNNTSPPSGTQLISNSPVDVNATRPWQGGLQQAAVREYGNGAVLFNAATCYWPRFLAGDPTWAADARVERMTANVLARVGITPPPLPTRMAAPQSIAVQPTGRSGAPQSIASAGSTRPPAPQAPGL